ncbi:MAG: glyoxalase, partial [Halieaceae bacterium]|nr:glyoxalase [Halieaceae bacterium]
MSLIIPAIKYADCNAAIDWLCSVFGFEIHFRVEGPGDTVAHAQLRLGEHMIMVGSTDRSDFGVLNVPPAQVGGKVTTSLYVCDEDVDTRFSFAVSAGAEIAIALREEDHG